jgi:flavin-dependent dehydrogenase
MRVTIIGNGIVANLGALYFRKCLPKETEIIIIGPEDRGGLPVVGESITENAANFLENELGLGEYLGKNHYPKYGLTYYFKLHPNDPDDRTYSVHCNERGLTGLKPIKSLDKEVTRPLAWLLNRSVFDKDIKEMVSSREDIVRIKGLVSNIELNSNKKHIIEVKEEGGKQTTIESDWVIDVTGRKQLLGRKLKNVIKPDKQRDCFWFRIADFDRNLLKKINALGPMPPKEGEPFHHDRYNTTHHFTGKGNWIWLIPLKSDSHSDLMSIGFVSRPDVYDGDVSTIDDFLEQVEAVHPVVSDLVRSGKIVDTNLLKKYHYYVNRVYSPDRWAIVGDAAFAPDPLFSNGLAFCTIQLEQLGEMIRQDIAGKHSPEYVNALSDAFLGPVLAAQGAITEWYSTMDDPFLSSLRLTWIEIAWYYMILPLVINHCHYDPKRVGLWKILQKKPNESAFDIPNSLITARKSITNLTPDHFLYLGFDKVNPMAMKKVEDIKELQEMIVKGGKLREDFTQEILERIKKLS